MQVKLIAILLTGFICHVSAKTFSQTVTLSGSNLKLENVLAAIEKQTGYTALYNEADFKNAVPVSLSVRDLSLKALLDVVFAEQPLAYTIRRTTIFIRHKPDETGKKAAEPVILSGPVKGRITDSTGRALPGVSIKAMRGSAIIAATQTDGRGEFAIGIQLQKGDRLYFSSIGFESQLITLDDAGAALNIVLKHIVNALTTVEVATVNTGYQRIRPEQSTGAVSQISTKEYESRVSSNFLDGLVNRLPGLMINNNVTFSNNGDARPLFNIRGISTMSANASPLIVIDGYPTELTLDMVDPNEIKSVTILKDAAAATVYGVRASNGVIVIERKQAAIGKPRFAFRATAEITPKENYSRYRWADNASSIVTNYQKDIYSKSVSAATWGQLSTATGGNVRRQKVFYILAQQAADMITPDQAAGALAEMENYDNIDDYSRLFQRTAVTQTYNLNVSGGNSNALYYIKANYTGNRLQDINNSNNRFMLSARSTIKLARRLSLELTNDYQEQFVKRAPLPDITSIAPYEHFQDVNGKPAYITGEGISPYYNDVLMSSGLYDHLYYPLTDVNGISDKTHTVNNHITANFNYDIGGGFDLAFGGIYETSRSDLDYFASDLTSVARQYVNDYVVKNADGTLKYNIPRGGYLRQQTANTSTYTARAQLNYNKKINGIHSINGILGGEIRNLVNKSKLASYFGYNDETLLQQPVDYAGITTGTITGSFNLSTPFLGGFNGLFDQQYTEDRFLSGYANIVYSLKNTYSLTGSIRIDQSNLFGTNPKYKYKPLWSAGAAWNIHNEDFMQDVTWVRQLKLRLAYGFNGNVAKMSLPQVIAQSVLNNYTSPASPALAMLSYANSSLRWEQTNSFNLGLDYHLFKNITGSIDYYRKKSTDLLGNALIDPTIGVSPSLINQASINNNGIEVSLHADWITRKNFNWNTGLVLARNTSKVVEVYQRGDFNPQTLNALGFVKGYPVGALFAYRYAGLDSAGYALVSNGKGTLYHTDVNSLGSAINALMASDTSGFTHYIGSSIPTINAGLSNRVDIGNFYIFCMINYYGGFKVRVPRPNPASPRPLEGAGDYWKKRGDEFTTDIMSLAGFNSFNSNNAYNYADKYVVNGDYITLADLTVSYSLDNTRFIRRTGFTHFEVKGQASNIVTFGLNKYNYSMGTGSFQKTYVTPTYTIGIFTNF
ncbi:SusC/RagA family TonB-linked outer membrane protein [Chitinophaga sp.]|uniref:SusC/RagA family TonB-linked outer membrane protein n=1 Tax=Chitinophaga sp. TaxID=1869181 RepID=UPI002C7BBDCC|nr:SusC/RagA family TonB-linked outer membrane protein [Chitinophaga sp.]HWV65264.1 SusC/RagA family TonB-linked outer membrane protein [Chitinophaga sp.]